MRCPRKRVNSTLKDSPPLAENEVADLKTTVEQIEDAFKKVGGA
jgi:hypothetical protein